LQPVEVTRRAQMHVRDLHHSARCQSTEYYDALSSMARGVAAEAGSCLVAFHHQTAESHCFMSFLWR
jgi:hypothetical protein